jgi:hypothetical protein
MKRPVGFTIMALILGWLALAGAGNAFVGPAQGLLRFFALAYAIAACVAAVGLWRMRSWAFAAYLVWAGVVLLTMIAMQLGRYRVALPAFAGFACFVILLLWLLANYVKRSLNKVIETDV